MIEAGAVVLPSDCGREFDQCTIAESLAQAGEEGIRDFDWRLSHGVGVFQNETLQFREIEVGTVLAQVGNLFGGDAVFSAYGRADVNSKRASDERRNPQFRQSF